MKSDKRKPCRVCNLYECKCKPEDDILGKVKVEPILEVKKPVEFKEPTTPEEMMEEVEVTLQLPGHVVAAIKDGRLKHVSTSVTARHPLRTEDEVMTFKERSYSDLVPDELMKDNGLLYWCKQQAREFLLAYDQIMAMGVDRDIDGKSAVDALAELMMNAVARYNEARLKEDRTDLKATGELLPLPEERVEDKPEFFQYDVAGHVGKDTQSSFFTRLADVETKLNGLRGQCDILSEHKANTDNVPEWSQHMEKRTADLEDDLQVFKGDLQGLEKKVASMSLEQHAVSAYGLVQRIRKLEDQAQQFENVIANGRTDFEEFESKLDACVDACRGLGQKTDRMDLDLDRVKDQLLEHAGAFNLIREVREGWDNRLTKLEDAFDDDDDLPPSGAGYCRDGKM